jgi:S-DNA-T family DNA segregation ATPase FtsK/SpoIIIE
VIGYRIGPTVTQFAVEPGYVEKTNSDGEVIQQKIKVSQIQNLSKDLALALSAERLRIEAPVASQSYVGIEVPNQYNTIVRLRSILESEVFQKLNSPLALALGRDVSGQPVVADLIKMPHLLIAGTTNSGKSVCITSIALCLVMNNSPEDLKLIMFDPKMVELVRFNELPHLLGKVETNQDRMQAALQWTIQEMDNRYKLLEASKARDLESYNRKMQRRGQATLPRIVVMIDELADLMMSRPEQTEFSLVRLAQLARATGIHLVVATQRPSAEIVTGLIKANFPARISFNVATSVDSRVILDVAGAETLLGKGDMLFINPEVGSPLRTQGVIVTDQEIAKAISFWKRITSIQPGEQTPWETLAAAVDIEEGEIGDDLIDQAIDIVRKSGKASASLLQRKMRIGFPRAARLIDELEEMGVIGSLQTGGKDREVIQGDRGYEGIQSADDEN